MNNITGQIADQHVFSKNNFDLLRLAAAGQVAIHHGFAHLHVSGLYIDDLKAVLSIFPGVPVFFFISGFLISRSFENNSNLREYAGNRILRIYPGLLFCWLGAVALVAGTGYFISHPVGAAEFGIWAVAQLTFLQFFNPEFLRDFGVGVINGSLWTISVELQFYLLIPVIYTLIGHISKRSADMLLLALCVSFAWLGDVSLEYSRAHDAALPAKLLFVSFIPWFWMFLVGVIFQRNFEAMRKLLQGKLFWLLSAYILSAIFFEMIWDVRIGNKINPALYLLLAATIFSAAYSKPALAESVLHRNDISYGVYIWHMPIINTMVYLGYVGGVVHLIGAMMIVAAVAWLSWKLVEKPALKLKRHPLNPLGSGPNVQHKAVDRLP